MEKRKAITAEQCRRLLQTHVAALQPYAPILPYDVLSAQLGIPIEQISKLDANENPYGPAPVVRQALGELSFAHIYPDPESRRLRQALAEYTGMPMELLLAGNGADELIELPIRALIEPGDAVINCPPAFGMYKFLAEVFGARLINIERDEHFALRLADIERAVENEPSAKLLLVTSPNNPDGGLLRREELERLLELPLLVLVDEAYFEFSQSPSFITLVEKYPNLAVIRTFSKWAGLAGLRVGYGAYPSWLIEALWKIRQPYSVNVAAQSAAMLSLKERDALLHNVSLLIAERERLSRLLGEIAWLKPFPSRANFILCRLLEGDAALIQQDLTRQGLLVRHYHSERLKDHLRFSVGKPEDTDRLVAALKNIR
jgi:histidinol-phosphate aminotransferase